LFVIFVSSWFNAVPVTQACAPPIGERCECLWAWESARFSNKASGYNLGNQSCERSHWSAALGTGQTLFEGYAPETGSGECSFASPLVRERGEIRCAARFVGSPCPFLPLW